MQHGRAHQRQAALPAPAEDRSGRISGSRERQIQMQRWQRVQVRAQYKIQVATNEHAHTRLRVSGNHIEESVYGVRFVQTAHPALSRQKLSLQQSNNHAHPAQ